MIRNFRNPWDFGNPWETKAMRFSQEPTKLKVSYFKLNLASKIGQNESFLLPLNAKTSGLVL